jgi:hypothetical protein
MITGTQPKILLEQEEMNWELVRSHDGLTKRSSKILWIEWNEDGTFKDKHDTPEIERSLIMSPFNQFFTWQTTTITELIEATDDLIRFKTRNSEYELRKIVNE